MADLPPFSASVLRLENERASNPSRIRWFTYYRLQHSKGEYSEIKVNAGIPDDCLLLLGTSVIYLNSTLISLDFRFFIATVHTESLTIPRNVNSLCPSLKCTPVGTQDTGLSGTRDGVSSFDCLV